MTSSERGSLGHMADIRFTATTLATATLSRVWDTATDWPAHSRWVPLTVVTVIEERGGLGTRFVGRTAIGPLGFNDPMTVTQWQPPMPGGTTAFCEVTKTGRLLTGTAGFTLTAVDSMTTRIEWFEDVNIVPRWLTRPLAPIVAALSAVGLRQSMRTLAKDAQQP